MVNPRETLTLGLPAKPEMAPVEWRISDSLVPYESAVAAMDERAGAIADGQAPELVWLLEHPPLYTAGTSANPMRCWRRAFRCLRPGRGGQMTYHGPGQRVAYVMLDLKAARAGRAPLRGDAGGMDYPHPRRLQRARRAARGPHRRLGAPAG